MTVLELEPKLDKIDNDDEDDGRCHICERGNDDRAWCGVDLSGYKWTGDPAGHVCDADCICKACLVIEAAAVAMGNG